MLVYYLLMESELSVLKVTSLFLNKEIKKNIFKSDHRMTQNYLFFTIIKAI